MQNNYLNKIIEKLIPTKIGFFLFRIHFYNFHVPHVQSFGCGPCAESFYTLPEQKDHHLWHRLSQTKYKCYKCDKVFDRMAGFSRHVCVPPPIFQINEIITDLTCELCKSIFATENLYYWHDCFIKNNGQCRKCKRHFVKRNMLFKHVIHCKAVAPIVVELPVKATTFVITPVTTKTTINISREGGRQKIVKSEPGSILEIEDVSHIEIPEIYLNDELLLKKPVVVLERHNLEKKRVRGRPKKTMRTATNNSKAVDEPLPEQLVLEEIPIPEILIPENPPPIISSVTTLGIQIKQEVLNADYGDFDANLARNIKKEKSDEEKRKAKERMKANSPKPTLKLKIKKEHGTLNASFVEQQEAAKEMTSPLPNDLMPEMPNDATTTAPTTSTVTLPKSIKDKIRSKNNKKRIFKNPFAALAMKIKKERTDAKETISVPVISQVGSAQDLILPKISSVTSVRKVQSMVRVKMEKPSPEHEVEYDYEEEEQEEEEEVQEEEEEMEENSSVPSSSVNIPDVIPASSLPEETEKVIEEEIPEISNSNELEVPEVSSVKDSEKLEENVTELSPDNLISTTEQKVEETIASESSVLCSPDKENKLQEDRTESILTTEEDKTNQRSEENLEIIIEKNVPETCSAEKEEVSEIGFEMQNERMQIEEIIENNGNSNIPDDVQKDSPDKVQSPKEVKRLDSVIEAQIESKTLVEHNSVEDESKTSLDVVMEEVPLQITENNKKIVFISKDVSIPFEMSSDVEMAEKPLMTTETDNQTVLNCIKDKMSMDVYPDVVMQENSHFINKNLEEQSNEDLNKQEQSQSPTDEESSISQLSQEISNTSHPETSTAEMVDETLNEIISSTVENCEKSNENFNQKTVENHLNFHSFSENNLEESQQKESIERANNINDLDDISSSSDVGSPISSEPMSDEEEDKLLDDGCDTNISLGKTNFG